MTNQVMPQNTLQSCFKLHAFSGLKIRRGKSLTIALLLLCLITLSSYAENSLDIVKDGKTQCVIVLGGERSKSKAHSTKRSKYTLAYPSNVLPEAATDLAHYLNEIAQIHNSKFQVQVVKDKDFGKKKYRILLGSVAIKKYGLEEEAQTLSYPAYIYRVIGNDLLIFGSSPKGTANGVYGFLQAELGIRWFGAQEIFHVVPKCDTITVKNVDKRITPSFLGRRFLTSTRREHPVYSWSARYMRMNEAVDNDEPFINSSHNLYRIYPPATYAKTHPEYYPLRNGKRIVPDVFSWTPCLSNPDVVAIAIKKAKDSFRTNKRQQSFSLGINDTSIFCQCAECQKHNNIIDYRGSTDWESNVYFRFVNQVARAVGKEFPERYIGCIVYNNITPPPDILLEKNVFAVIVSDLSEYFDPSYCKGEEELIKAWEKKCANLGLYYYEGLAKLVPAYFPRLVSKQMKAKHKQGFKSLTCEVNPGWPWHGPMPYITAQLWWDINLDIDSLLQEYFSKLYGPAAEPMKLLYELFEQIHMRPRNGGFLYEHYKLAQFRPYTINDLVKMRKYLAQAHSLAVESRGFYCPPKDDIAQRVAYVSNGLQVFLSMLEAYVKAKEFERPLEFNNISVLSRLNEIDQVNSILVNHDTLYRETIRGDEFLSKRYTWDRCIRLRDEWRNFVLSGISKALADLYRWNEKKELNIYIKKRLEKILNDFNAEPYRHSLFMLQTKQAKLGPNLVPNPGFEKTAGLEEYPIGPEWVPSKFVSWALWPGKNKDGFTVNIKERHSGERSACVSDISSGTYITTVSDIKPGKSYYVSAYSKCLPPPRGETQSIVKLSVQWLNSENKWLKYGSNVFSDKLNEVNQWEKLETIVKVPDGAAAAVLLLSATLPFGEKVFFDDITFQEIDTPKIKLGPNFLKNGGFEEVFGEYPHEKCPPEKKNLPYAWNTSRMETHKGITDTVKTNVRTGQRAARIKGMGKVIYFLQPSQSLGNSPGIYLCEAWAKNLSKSPTTRISMDIGWYNHKGWMGEKARFKAQLKETEQWSKIEIIATPPEGAIRMAVFLKAEYLGIDDEVFFDDISVRRIIAKQ